ncbi:FkbM family methyltransferase [Cylindrospermopsis raciborskii]|uniref:Methyltransferase n=1 Tax=Cylindrospermopsis raciborskii CENA302 TaxID=1170768 RepID=A0A9Q5QZ60_9CYAN|nr:FkbM family methyltransferase [Cylindrospermopsis raciborskii]OPH11092.1 methyltransferase [Cylindrospermopsis raciborskii CENA302]
MPNPLKEAMKAILSGTVSVLGRTGISQYIFQLAVNNAMDSTLQVLHRGIKLSFSTPNSLNYWRVSTFSSKEPETLEWIDSFPENVVLWDIGANVGLYSVYASVTKNCTVFAFEPSVFNLELLARNIFLNGLSQKVTIIPLPLSDRISLSSMRMTSTEWGGALSTFGKEFGFDGEPIKQTFEFSTLGMTMDEAVTLLKIPTPDFIKMDVDGLEHFILQGGANVLKNTKGVLIEVNDDFEEQAKSCHDLLVNAGLSLKEKRHSDIIASSTSGFANCYNQIWVRS